jgi:hypothetical protein
MSSPRVPLNSAKATGSDTFASAGSGGLLSLTDGEEKYTIEELGTYNAVTGWVSPIVPRLTVRANSFESSVAP